MLRGPLLPFAALVCLGTFYDLSTLFIVSYILERAVEGAIAHTVCSEAGDSHARLNFL